MRILNKEYVIDLYFKQLEASSIIPPIVFDKPLLRSCVYIYGGSNNQKKDSCMYGLCIRSTAVVQSLMDPEEFGNDVSHIETKQYLLNEKRGALIPTVRPVYIWYLPPVKLYKNGTVEWIKGVSLFDFPVPYQESDRNKPYIDSQYILNATTFTRYMLCQPKMDMVERSDYRVYGLSSHARACMEHEIKKFYKKTPSYVFKGNTANKMFPLWHTFYGLLFFNYGQHWFILEKDGEILAMIIWSQNEMFVNIPFIVTVEDGSGGDLDPYLWHLILYEFAKRFPRDTMFNIGGNGGSTKLADMMAHTGYLHYMVVPTRTDFISNRRIQFFRTPEMDIPLCDKNMYLHVDPYYPLLKYRKYLPAGHHFEKFFRLFDNVTLGLPPHQARRKFFRFVELHNTRLIRKYLKKRKAKTKRHYYHNPYLRDFRKGRK